MSDEAPKKPVWQPRDPAPLARVVIVFLWIYAAAYAVVTVVSAIQAQALQSVTPSMPMESGDPIPGAGEFVQFAAIADLPAVLVFLVAGILTLRWIYRVNKNARVLAPDKKVGPGWAVAWYFIPIAVWWKPFQAMRETWQISTDPAAWNSVPVPQVMRWWWGFWIADNLIGNISWRLSLGHQTAGSLFAGDVFDTVDGLLSIAAAFALMPIVREITRRQVGALSQRTFT